MYYFERFPNKKDPEHDAHKQGNNYHITLIKNGTKYAKIKCQKRKGQSSSIFNAENMRGRITNWREHL